MEISIKEYYKKMNECKAYLDQLQKRKRNPSENTIKQYRKDAERMKRDNLNPLTFVEQNGATKNTFYKYRAAWAYTYTELAKDLHKAADKEKDKNEKAYLIDCLVEAVKQIKEFEPDPKGKNFKLAEKGLFVSEWNGLKKNANPGQTKKYQRLPAGWAEKYFHRVKNSKYAPAIALMSMTGCRPAEIVRGVVVTLMDNLSIKVCIESKKTHCGEYGQKFRSFVVKSKCIEHEFLISLLKSNNKNMLIQIHSEKRLTDQMNKYSKIAFPGLKSIISPYTYRHQFAKKVKTSLGSKIDVAIVMGHSNDKSQRHYANKSRREGGGFEISEIKGTREVKVVSNTGFDFSFLKNSSVFEM